MDNAPYDQSLYLYIFQFIVFIDLLCRVCVGQFVCISSSAMDILQSRHVYFANCRLGVRPSGT